MGVCVCVHACVRACVRVRVCVKIGFMCGAFGSGYMQLFSFYHSTKKEVVREDCQARKLNKEDATDRCKWRKMIKEAR